MGKFDYIIAKKCNFINVFIQYNIIKPIDSPDQHMWVIIIWRKVINFSATFWWDDVDIYFGLDLNDEFAF